MVATRVYEGVGIGPSVWCIDLSCGKMGMSPSSKPKLCSPLGCILKNWNKFGGDTLNKGKMKQYCVQ